MRNTCCSLNCPFIGVCKEYNFLAERGEKCDTMEAIIEKAEKVQKKRKKAQKKLKKECSNVE